VNSIGEAISIVSQLEMAPPVVAGLVARGLIDPPIAAPCFDDEPFFPSYIASTPIGRGVGDAEAFAPSGFGTAEWDSLAQIKSAAEYLEALCLNDFDATANDDSPIDQNLSSFESDFINTRLIFSHASSTMSFASGLSSM
jgi:hypothetical protein